MQSFINAIVYGIMIIFKEIGKHLKSVLEEDVEGTDSLSFARRLYKALTSKTCDSLYGGEYYINANPL